MTGSKVAFYEEIYKNRSDYKRDLFPMFKNIRVFLSSAPRSVLDYGCGQGNLADIFASYYGSSITKYDPAIPSFSQFPQGRFDLAVNTDVLEHIPTNEIDTVLNNIRKLADRAFFNIHLSEAAEILSNGENAHCTIQPPEWWRNKIEQHFGQAYIVPSLYPYSCSVLTWKPRVIDVFRCRLMQAASFFSIFVLTRIKIFLYPVYAKFFKK